MKLKLMKALVKDRHQLMTTVQMQEVLVCIACCFHCMHYRHRIRQWRWNWWRHLWRISWWQLFSCRRYTCTCTFVVYKNVLFLLYTDIEYDNAVLEFEGIIHEESDDDEGDNSGGLGILFYHHTHCNNIHLCSNT